jgi:hypothetical protein
MKVQIMSGYDTVESVDAKNLKRLIAEKKVIAFRRSKGWIKVRVDPLRGDGGDYYDGPERRNIVQKRVPEKIKKCLLCIFGVRGPRVDW